MWCNIGFAEDQNIIGTSWTIKESDGDIKLFKFKKGNRCTYVGIKSYSGNEGKIYEIGGPKIISFGDMVKSIMKTLNKKKFVVEMPMPIAKIQSSVMSLLPIPPILTRDQCEILSEADNIVSNNHLTLQDLNVKPSDVEEAMKKWLWRFRDGGEFAKVQ